MLPQARGGGKEALRGGIAWRRFTVHKKKEEKKART
jgi:hypothetical protein